MKILDKCNIVGATRDLAWCQAEHRSASSTEMALIREAGKSGGGSNRRITRSRAQGATDHDASAKSGRRLTKRS